MNFLAQWFSSISFFYRYEPNTIDLSDRGELEWVTYSFALSLGKTLSYYYKENNNNAIFAYILYAFCCSYWFTVLSAHLPDLVDKVNPEGPEH